MSKKVALKGVMLGMMLSCSSVFAETADLSTVAQDACNQAQQARHEAGERKKLEFEQVFQNTIGRKLERIAKNCADALSRATVPYVNANPSGIIDALLGAANSACMQVAGKVQQQQQQIMGAFNKSLPYGMGGVHSKSVKIGQGGMVGWEPADIRGFDGKRINLNDWK